MAKCYIHDLDTYTPMSHNCLNFPLDAVLKGDKTEASPLSAQTTGLDSFVAFVKKAEQEAIAYKNSGLTPEDIDNYLNS